MGSGEKVKKGRVLENKFMDYIVLKQADPLNAYDKIVVDSKNTFQIKAQQFPKPFEMFDTKFPPLLE